MKGIAKFVSSGMSSASAQSSTPEVRPLPERARDYAIVAGVCGGLAGACGAARHGAPVLVASAVSFSLLFFYLILKRMGGI